jgi:hypothetical protein
VKKIMLMVAGVLGVLALMRRKRSRQDERALWREATTTSPDLR